MEYKKWNRLIPFIHEQICYGLIFFVYLFIYGIDEMTILFYS